MSQLLLSSKVSTLALTDAGPPSIFEDRTKDQTRRNDAVKANLARDVIVISLQIFLAQSILRDAINIYDPAKIH